MKANKRLARFGDRYLLPNGPDYLPVGFNIRKFSNALREAMPAIHRMTATLRQVADSMRRAREMEETARQVEAIINGPGERWSVVPHVANSAAPTLAELEAGTPIRGIAASAGTHSQGGAIDVRLAHTAEETVMHGLLYGNAYIPIGYTGEDGLVEHHEPLSFDAFIAHADQVLAGHDAQRSTGKPWPYEEEF